MADGRELAEWTRAGSIMVNTRIAMSAEKNPASVAELIPRKYHPKPPELSEEAKQREKERAWDLLALNMFGGE